MLRFLFKHVLEFFVYIVFFVFSFYIVFCHNDINPVACVAFGTYIITIIHRISTLWIISPNISLDILTDNEIDKYNKRVDCCPINSLFEFIFTNKSAKYFYIKFIRIKTTNSTYELFNGLKENNIKKLEPGEFLHIQPKKPYKFGYIRFFFNIKSIELETTDGYIFNYKKELNLSRSIFKKENKNFYKYITDKKNENYLLDVIEDIEKYSGWKLVSK